MTKQTHVHGLEGVKSAWASRNWFSFHFSWSEKVAQGFFTQPQNEVKRNQNKGILLSPFRNNNTIHCKM